MNMCSQSACRSESTASSLTVTGCVIHPHLRLHLLLMNHLSAAFLTLGKLSDGVVLKTSRVLILPSRAVGNST